MMSSTVKKKIAPTEFMIVFILVVIIGSFSCNLTNPFRVIVQI